MFKLAFGLLVAALFIAAAHAHADTLPSVSFSPAPPPSAQAQYVKNARALVKEMVTAATEHQGAGYDRAVMVLWPGAALAHTSSSEVCSAINVLASLHALPDHASAVCLETDGSFTVALTSAGIEGNRSSKGGAQ